MRYFPEFALQTGGSIIPHLYSVAAATTIIAAPRVKAEAIQTAELEGRKLVVFIPFVVDRFYFI